ncbi:DNA-directed RNA polymerase subunit beta [Bacillus rubiinfantis]|uniref:DNA-directed RNA polymerase subunit beta n=1 Tax=Bacillus rubiinfantis TaxID=1499680 RepID=UPI0005A680E7|nr:DNA-directed RNA polymerase subunit beta [Bacillus rubiinfantis]
MALNNPNQEKVIKREEYKKKKDQIGQENSEVREKRVRIRLIPIWLRLVLLIIFVFISVTVGAVVGYSLLGGGKVTDVFKVSTWTHIDDLVEKEK